MAGLIAVSPMSQNVLAMDAIETTDLAAREQEAVKAPFKKLIQFMEQATANTPFTEGVEAFLLTTFKLKVKDEAEAKDFLQKLQTRMNSSLADKKLDATNEEVKIEYLRRRFTKAVAESKKTLLEKSVNKKSLLLTALTLAGLYLANTFSGGTSGQVTPPVSPDIYNGTYPSCDARLYGRLGQKCGLNTYTGIYDFQSCADELTEFLTQADYYGSISYDLVEKAIAARYYIEAAEPVKTPMVTAVIETFQQANTSAIQSTEYTHIDPRPMETEVLEEQFGPDIYNGTYPSCEPRLYDWLYDFHSCKALESFEAYQTALPIEEVTTTVNTTTVKTDKEVTTHEKTPAEMVTAVIETFQQANTGAILSTERTSTAVSVRFDYNSKDKMDTLKTMLESQGIGITVSMRGMVLTIQLA